MSNGCSKSSSSSGFPNPCLATGNNILGLVKGVLLECAQKNEGVLSIDKIESIIDKIMDSPGDLPKLYDANFRNCMASVQKRPDINFNCEIDFRDSLPKDISVGHLQIIGLDDIKSSLGEKWQKLSEKIYAISENCISKQLGFNDSFTRTKDNDFLICFSTLSDSEGLLKAQAIKNNILQSVFGEDAKLIFEEFNLSEGQWEKIKKIKVNSQEVCVTSEDINGGDVGGRLLEKLQQATIDMKADTNNILSDTLSACHIDAIPILNLTHKRKNEAVVSLDVTSHARLRQLIDQSSDKEKIISEIDNVSLILTGEYLCNQENILGSDLVVSVDYATINTPDYLSKYLNICSNLSDDVRKKIIFSLNVTSDNINNYGILDKFNILRPFCTARSITIDNINIKNMDLAFSGI